MKTLHLATIAIFLSVIIGMITFHSIYAQVSEFPNSIGLTTEQCQNKLNYEKENTADLIDKTKAVKLAMSSPDFQSMISGHRYALVHIFTNETWDTSLCGDVKVTAIGIGFNLLDNTTGFKSIEVTEDSPISNVTKVNLMSSPICSLNCGEGKPISNDFEPQLQFQSFVAEKMTPNSTVPIGFDFTNNGNYALHDVIISYFDFPLVSNLHLPSEIISLNSGEHKTIFGSIHAPSELLDVPILVTSVVSTKDKDDRIGVQDFQQIINLANMSSYERTSSTMYLDSPLKQFKLGISANNVTCKTEFQLVLKSEDNSPACVKPDTVNILIEHGWAKASQ